LQEKITELENCVDKLRQEIKKLKASSSAELDELRDELGSLVTHFFLLVRNCCGVSSTHHVVNCCSQKQPLAIKAIVFIAVTHICPRLCAGHFQLAVIRNSVHKPHEI